ncbi:glycoside hydrolase superfamily [Gilbertella persicaria]|uniref:glycoside hydrolase superfamily n=1 Tax=Gilbertella persicaria TaxID=101096 RepID=UPI00221E7DFD|nr:glycoside hydrolase superfamily [Gilbertella persicaria]KAI8063346.1 glycoside hydrolase superfamily [Gilbertella persicaria]
MRLYLLLLIFFSLVCASTTKKTYGKHRLVSYVVDWEIPKSINWSLMDHVVYAFAEPDVHGNLKEITSSSLKSFTKTAHQHHVGVSISVGGWSGSRYLSSLVKTEAKRKTFVNNIVKLVAEYNLDGVNLDWEYPNDPNGMSCNQRQKDTANYLLFIKHLRKELDAKYPKIHKIITLAVTTRPFNDEKGHSIKKLDQDWSKTVDTFYVMAYDISGSWMVQAGPNAPLKPASARYYETSVTQAITAWYNAGIPKTKLTLGVPFYGTVLKTQSKVHAAGLYVKLANNNAIKGDKYDEYAADPCPGAAKSYTGGYQWRSIHANGIQSNKDGWKTYWDSRSVTPYAFHANDKKFLTFDNVKSLQAKVNYVKSQKLGGAMIWSLEMDDSSHTLLRSLQSVRH